MIKPTKNGGENTKNSYKKMVFHAILVPWNIIEDSRKKDEWRQLDNDTWDIDSDGNLSFKLDGEETMYDSEIMKNCYKK